MAIKNIIFDLGGVILNIDYRLTLRAFQQLGATHFTEDFTKNPQHTFFIDFEIGKITSAQFRYQLRHFLRLTLTDQQLDDAWCALLLDIPNERLQVLRQLRQQYRTFLYSNTNAIHLQRILKICVRDHQLHSLDDFFEKQYYSHLLGIRKPDVAGYLAILKENNLLPGETLFIDDLYANIAGAQQAGLRAFHLTGPYTLLDVPKLVDGDF